MPMHDGIDGPQILNFGLANVVGPHKRKPSHPPFNSFHHRRHRGWLHRVLILFFSRPDRREW